MYVAVLEQRNISKQLSTEVPHSLHQQIFAKLWIEGALTSGQCTSFASDEMPCHYSNVVQILLHVLNKRQTRTVTFATKRLLEPSLIIM